MKKHQKEPRIILFDLETLPNLLEVLYVYPQLSNFPGLTLKANITSIICGGWKVLGEKKTHCINAWDFPSWKLDCKIKSGETVTNFLKRILQHPNDDYALVKAISDVLVSSDMVITHNGKRFDWKFLQTRLHKHKLPPLPEIRHVDTCSLAKSNLFLLNNKLNTIAGFLTNEQKMEHGGWKELWGGVWLRVNSAMKTMTAYCKKDVEALEAVYLDLRPHAKNIPNHNIWNDRGDNVCPTCGHSQYHKNGTKTTDRLIIQRYMCNRCKKTFSHSRKRDIKPLPFKA